VKVDGIDFGFSSCFDGVGVRVGGTNLEVKLGGLSFGKLGGTDFGFSPRFDGVGVGVVEDLEG
jgi:hypothetical protein